MIQLHLAVHFTRTADVPPATDPAALEAATETVVLPDIESETLEGAIAAGAESFTRFAAERVGKAGDTFSLTLAVAALR